MSDLIQLQILIEAKTKQTNHILHLILTFCTFGFWVIIWILLGLSNTIENGRMKRKLTNQWELDNARREMNDNINQRNLNQ